MTDPILDYESSDTGLELRQKLNLNNDRRHWRNVTSLGYVSFPYTLADGVEYAQVDLDAAEAPQSFYLPGVTNYPGRVVWIELTSSSSTLNIYANGTETINGAPHICVYEYNALIVLVATSGGWTAWKLPRYLVTAPPGTAQTPDATPADLAPTTNNAGTTI